MFISVFDEMEPGTVAILVLAIIIVVAIIISLALKPRKPKRYPITYIYNDNKDAIDYIIYQQQSGSFEVYNKKKKDTAPAVFKEWSDVTKYIELEQTKW